MNQPENRLNFILEETRIALCPEHLRKDETLGQRLEWILTQVQNHALCFADCKGMYFCLLERGHTGNHNTGTGLAWSCND